MNVDILFLLMYSSHSKYQQAKLDVIAYSFVAKMWYTQREKLGFRFLFNKKGFNSLFNEANKKVLCSACLFYPVFSYSVLDPEAVRSACWKRKQDLTNMFVMKLSSSDRLGSIDYIPLVYISKSRIRIYYNLFSTTMSNLTYIIDTTLVTL